MRVDPVGRVNQEHQRESIGLMREEERVDEGMEIQSPQLMFGLQ